MSQNPKRSLCWASVVAIILATRWALAKCSGPQVGGEWITLSRILDPVYRTYMSLMIKDTAEVTTNPTWHHKPGLDCFHKRIHILFRYYKRILYLLRYEVR